MHTFTKVGTLFWISKHTSEILYQIQIISGIYTNTKRSIINQPVALKIIWEHEAMDEEMAIFNALNATDNLEIEKHGIPRVYYNGPFLKHYHAIVMTLFDGTVADRYEKERANGQSLSDLVILSIFMQAVRTMDT